MREIEKIKVFCTFEMEVDIPKGASEEEIEKISEDMITSKEMLTDVSDCGISEVFNGYHWEKNFW